MTARITRRRRPGREPFGPGWELRVRGRAVVRVVPEEEGWRVTNAEGGRSQVVPSRERAEELADRIARLASTL